MWRSANKITQFGLYIIKLTMGVSPSISTSDRMVLVDYLIVIVSEYVQCNLFLIISILYSLLFICPETC